MHAPFPLFCYTDHRGNQHGWMQPPLAETHRTSQACGTIA